MRIDFIVKFAKEFWITYSIVDGELRAERSGGLLYTVFVVDNIQNKEKYNHVSARDIPGIVFRQHLALNEDILNINQFFYEKWLVGWYSIDKNIKEFFTPTSARKIYENMSSHMEDYTSDEGDLVLYFESV